MLPELILDNEEFDEIIDEARNRIVSLYPEWTDFNYHDPGITLIELFSWLKEGQQYYLDQISDESREKYLKLLGLSRRHKIPATAYVLVKPSEDITVLDGTRLYAGDACFEADREKQLVEGDVAWCFYREKGNRGKVEPDRMGGGLPLRIQPFGQIPEEGGCFYIGFKQPLPVHTELGIFMEVTNSWDIPRNPLEGPMAFPLARLSMQYFGSGGWREVTRFLDGTYGMAAAGELRFELPEEMGKSEDEAENGYYLRLILEENHCDVPPVICGVSINMMMLIQRERVIEKLELPSSGLEQGQCTVSTIMALNGRNDIYIQTGQVYCRLSSFTKRCNFDTGVTLFELSLPEGISRADGIRIVSYLEENTEKKLLETGSEFPNQEYGLDDPAVDYESFGLMVQSMDHPRMYQDWIKVLDFSNSGPEDRHYVLDAKKGSVRFGDGIRGMAPEGDIVIVSYVRTLGRRGNVKAYQIDHFDGVSPEDIPVYNADDCKGGRDEESLEECFIRAKKELKSPITAVSDADYERHVMETPGLMLESCKVIPSDQMRQIKNTIDETEINIVVKPFSKGMEKGLSSVYKNNILSHLEQFRMVGRSIHLLSPRYITFEVYGDIVVYPHFVGAREIVRETVNDYFARISGLFGVSVQYSDLYGMIDILKCVSHINSLTIDAKGSGIVRSKDGTIKIPPNGAARLGNAQYLFGIGE